MEWIIVQKNIQFASGISKAYIQSYDHMYATVSDYNNDR